MAACTAATLMAAVAGCEYFTSERLGLLKPGKPGEAASKAADAPASTSTDQETITRDPATGEPMRLTAAEVLAMLERIIRGNQQELDGLAPRLEDKAEEEQARDVFQHLDDLAKSLEREKKKAAAEGQTERVAEIERQAKGLEKPWGLARERLNLDLRSRMLALERVQILREILAHDRGRMTAILASGDVSRFLDESKPTPTPAAAPGAVAAPAGATDAMVPAAAPSGPPAAEDAPAPAQAPAPSPPVQISIVPGQPLIPTPVDPKAAAKAESAKTEAEKKADVAKAGEAAKKDDAEKSEGSEKKAAPPPNKELISAKQDLQSKSTTVQKLQERTMTLDIRMQSLARSIELIRELVDLSKKRVENANQTREFLLSEIQEGKPSAALQAWVHDGDDAAGAMDRLARTAAEDARRLEDRFAEMVEERAMVLDALQRTNIRAKTAQEGLEKTQEKVEALESPLSSHNIRAWLWAHGPSILATLVVMTVLYLLVSRYAHKVVEIFAARGLRGSKAERDNRMDTLVSVLQNTGSVVVLVGGGSTLLSQVGIPVTPLLGGAAVAGVAVAFGAQNLIKDFFYGFMILLENQYKLKDIVKIGDHSGQVEQITLRMTALRDGDGGLHFLPNGATTSVVNLTHGWSSASFSVRIAWEEDVDRVIGIIQDLGKEIRQDPKLRLMIVDDLNMMGVDALTDNAVVILFSIKTLPLQQWTIKREFLKRLKKKFQEKNVLLPPPPTVSPAG